MNNIIIELEVVVDDADDRCDRCHLNGMFDTVLCPNSAERLTGVNCHESGIFKKPENWVQCTRENTKVGDEIRLTGGTILRTIEHFYEFKPVDVWTVLLNNGDCTFNGRLSEYEININR